MKPITLGAVALLVMNFTYTQLPGDRPAANHRSTRSVVMARHGMIATSQPLASAAGPSRCCRTAATRDRRRHHRRRRPLAVVEPTMNGVGGDLFA
jgi:gamma-glutamyltranspeptidase/glutathione hydrolase